MTVLLVQISVEKLKAFSSILYERALDSVRPLSYMMNVVGSIKDFDDDEVLFFFFLILRTINGYGCVRER